MTGRFRQSAASAASFGRQFLVAPRGVVLLSCLVVAGGVCAQDDWASTRESFLCKSSTEVREIKTYISNSPESDRPVHGCRVDYIKNGVTQTIWSSRASPSYCDGKASQVAAKLEASHFSCSPLHLQQSDEG